IDARVLSSLKEQRVAAGKVLGNAGVGESAFAGADREGWKNALRDALFAARVCSYAQGMALIAAGSEKYAWNINLAEMARIWKGGCIIRARLLDPVREAFTTNPALPNLLVDPTIARDMLSAAPGWRRVVAAAVSAGIAVPSLGA